MIKIQVNSEMFAYDLYHIIKAFYPGRQIEQAIVASCENAIEVYIGENAVGITTEELSEQSDRASNKRYVNFKIYDWLAGMTGKQLSWGIMTGVRPTKPMMQMLEKKMTDAEVIGWMKRHYKVTDEKARFASCKEGKGIVGTTGLSRWL